MKTVCQTWFELPPVHCQSWSCSAVTWPSLTSTQKSVLARRNWPSFETNHCCCGTPSRHSQILTGEPLYCSVACQRFLRGPTAVLQMERVGWGMEKEGYVRRPASRQRFAPCSLILNLVSSPTRKSQFVCTSRRLLVELLSARQG